MSTRRLLLVWALLLTGLVCITQQPTSAYWQSRDSNYNIAISGGGGGGVVFDFASSTGVAANVGTTVTLSHASPGSPSGVGVAVCNYAGGGVSTSGITYGIQALTQKVLTTIGGPLGITHELWGSDGRTLPSGTQNIVVTLSGAGGFDVVGAITVTGGSTVTTFSGAPQSTTGTSAAPSLGVTSGSTSELVMSSACTGSGSTFTASQTSRWGTTAAAPMEAAGSTSAGASGTVTMGWTMSTSDFWAEVGGSFH